MFADDCEGPPQSDLREPDARSKSIGMSKAFTIFLGTSDCFPPLAVIQVNPGPSEVITITTKSKTRAGPLKGLSLCRRSSIIIVGPFFSGGRMRAHAEDREFTGDQHFRDNLLVFASFEIRAGMNVYCASKELPWPQPFFLLARLSQESRPHL